MQAATRMEPSTEERADLYRWFSSLFARELDAQAWKSHVSEDFVAALDEQARELGLEDDASSLRGYLLAHREDDVDEAVLALAVDYARLFIGPGPGEAPPYESIYTSPSGRLYADAYAAVQDVLQREKIGVAEDFHAPVDHAAVELSIMAHLLDGGEAGESTAEAHSSESARDFFDQHIMNWFPDWTAHIDARAETDFYRGVTRFMMGFLRGEGQRLESESAS